MAHIMEIIFNPKSILLDLKYGFNLEIDSNFYRQTFLYNRIDVCFSPNQFYIRVFESELVIMHHVLNNMQETKFKKNTVNNFV